MALIKCAGFDYLTPLAPASVLASLGFTGCTVLQGQGRAGGGAARLGQINLPARLGTFYCGFALFNPVNVGISFNDSTVGGNFSLNFSSAGAILCGFQGTTVGSPPMAVIPGAIWQYIEVYGVIAADNEGAITVRVNENIVLQISSADTSAAGGRSLGIDQIDFGNTMVDDFYICDNSGASLNNFLGNTRVPAQSPNGAGASTQWTPTGSASFMLILHLIRLPSTRRLRMAARLPHHSAIISSAASPPMRRTSRNSWRICGRCRNSN